MLTPSTTAPALPANERGTLLIVVLFILLVTTILGLSAMAATGLEMQMSSNSREQLVVREAAEYVVTQVINEIQAQHGFSKNSLINYNCDPLCFDENCTGGYCFFGAASGDPTSWASCLPGLPLAEPAHTSAVWVDNSGRHNKVVVADPEVSVKYIIEFRCYAALDDSLAMSDTNNTKVFRITTLVTSKNERSRVMLRVALKNL